MGLASPEIQESQSTKPDLPPLLSIVVPVYNGSKKIEAALGKLDNDIGKLDYVGRKLEAQNAKREKGQVNTGRNIIRNASAGLLLDNYLSEHPAEVPSELSNISYIETQQQLGREAQHFDSVIYSTAWYEIIVVNDGSRDDTREIVQRISSANERIRLISYSSNMGKGYATKQGVLHSRGKYVIFMDGDGEIGTEILTKYLEAMTHADIVIGSKYHQQSAVSVPISRKLLSKCFQLFVRLMLGTKVTDTQVGFKGGRGDIFRKIFQKVTVKRYAFDAEMLAVANILKLKIDELPVNITLEKSFKKKEIAKMAFDVLGIAFRLRVVNWYQKNMEKKRPNYNPLFFI
jgi:glycosyltransferase involved in cell wall biosynthesis